MLVRMVWRGLFPIPPKLYKWEKKLRQSCRRLIHRLRAQQVPTIRWYVKFVFVFVAVLVLLLLSIVVIVMVCCVVGCCWIVGCVVLLVVLCCWLFCFVVKQHTLLN